MQTNKTLLRISASDLTNKHAGYELFLLAMVSCFTSPCYGRHSLIQHDAHFCIFERSWVQATAGWLHKRCGSGNRLANKVVFNPTLRTAQSQIPIYKASHPVRPPAYCSIHLPMRLSACLCIYPSVHPPIHPSIDPFLLDTGMQILNVCVKFMYMHKVLPKLHVVRGVGQDPTCATTQRYVDKNEVALHKRPCSAGAGISPSW